MIRIEGFDGSVTYRAEKLRALGGQDVSVERDPARLQAGWAWVRDVQAMHGQPGDIWRLSCKPSDAPGLVAKAGAAQVLYDWGGGLVWLRLPGGTDLRTRLGVFDGHATCLRGGFPRFHPEPAPVAALSQGVRSKFDPKGILNPGLMP